MYSAIRVIPILLVSDDELVKTVKFNNRKYIGDPINTVKIFNEKEVDELVIFDIDASRNGEINYSLIEDMVSEAFMPISYGGAVGCVEDITKLIRLGIEKVILNTSAYDDKSFIREAVSIFGSQAIVGCIDVKRNILGSYNLYTNNGTEKKSIKLENHISSLIEAGVGEIIIHDISRDGTMQGYDFDLINHIIKLVNVPVVICGGAGNLDDLLKAKNETCISGVGASSMFIYYGKRKAVLVSYLNRKDLKEFERNINVT